MSHTDAPCSDHRYTLFDPVELASVLDLGDHAIDLTGSKCTMTLFSDSVVMSHTQATLGVLSAYQSPFLVATKRESSLHSHMDTPMGGLAASGGIFNGLSSTGEVARRKWEDTWASLGSRNSDSW